MSIRVGEREIFKSQSDVRLIRQSENLRHLAGKNAWTVYQASPLQKISFEKISFKKYEALFMKKLQGCTVTFSCLTGLPNAIPSLLIEVIKNGKDIYSSVFLSLSTIEESEDNLSLPVVLVHRPAKKEVILNVHRIIENTFRCRVRPVKLTEYQSYWMMGIGLKESLRSSYTPMKIICKLPINISANIELYFDEKSMSAIWNSIDDSEDDILSINTVKTFFSEVQSHIKNTYGIDPSTSPIISFALKDMCLQFFDEQLCLSVRKPEDMYMLLCYLLADCISY